MKKINNFAIITDFGFDYSVASMKALIYKEFAKANIIDIDHSIEKFSIISGAFIINSIYHFFPDNTIFICVVDPGVGTSRDLIYFRLNKYHFIGPNNGVFHYILKNNNSVIVKKVKEDKFINQSNTFHGRDIMTPVAIELAKGNCNIFKKFDKKNINYISKLEGKSQIIVYIDNFGNIKTNISPNNEIFKLFSKLIVNINNKLFDAIFLNTFSEVEPGRLICYKGSNETLEIAINLGSARDYLSANIGDKIRIKLKNKI